jgi:hypothetical protein
MRLLLALLVAAAGCGGCGGNGESADAGGPPRHEAGQARDAGPEVPAPAQLDAGECSAPRCVTDPPATHRAVVAYNELVAGADPELTPFGIDAPFALFVDSAGVASLGANYSRRLDFDGNLVSSSRGPRRHSYPTTAPLEMLSTAVQYPGGYAVIVQEYVGSVPILYLCRIVDDTWPDLASCAVLDIFLGWTPVLAWNGAAFEVFTNKGVSLFDADGVPLGSYAFTPAPTNDEGPTGALHVGEKLVLDWYGSGSMPCNSDVLYVLPATYDFSLVEKLDLEPSDFVNKRLPLNALAGPAGAFLSSGECVDPHPLYPGNRCNGRVPAWPSAFLSIVGADGQPSVLRQSVPAPMAEQLIWDGSILVAGYAAYNYQLMHLMGLDGSLLGVAWVGPELGISIESRILGISRMVAVAPNDYIMTYTLRDTGELWVARFSLVPL